MKSSRKGEVVKDLPEKDNSVPRNLLFALGGIAALVLASKGIIDSASAIAAYFGISQIVIGMTVVAIGTSLPELAASIMAQLNQESDISVGNVIGSNLFNMFFVGGGVAGIRGLPNRYLHRLILKFHFMLIFTTMLLFPVIFVRKGQKPRQCGRVSGPVYYLHCHFLSLAIRCITFPVLLIPYPGGLRYADGGYRSRRMVRIYR
ncbi:MAG: hypothetical protein U5N26_08975 [Candidatus Marinimicrobia bacterium]|nr:hypothetical protein [Candidatus Neomarinimicrobiota bacterium]